MKWRSANPCCPRSGGSRPKTVAMAVTRVVVSVGPLSGVEITQLARAFDLARMGTVAEGAELEIEDIPVTIWCAPCGIESRVEPNKLLCGGCGGWRVTLRSGDELLLKRLSLVDAPERQSASG